MCRPGNRLWTGSCWPTSARSTAARTQGLPSKLSRGSSSRDRSTASTLWFGSSARSGTGRIRLHAASVSKSAGTLGTARPSRRWLARRRSSSTAPVRARRLPESCSSTWPAAVPSCASPARTASRAGSWMNGRPGLSPRPLRGVRMSAELADLAQALESDLVHAHYLPEFGWMAARKGLAPLVCSAWGSDVLVGGRLATGRSRRALDGASVVFADSKHLAEGTRVLAGRELRVEVVRGGLDLDRFSPGAAAAAPRALG